LNFITSNFNIEVLLSTNELLCALFSVLFPTFTIENVFSVHGDETVLVFEEQKYYVWLLIIHETNLIWHVSKYRDM